MGGDAFTDRRPGLPVNTDSGPGKLLPVCVFQPSSRTVLRQSESDSPGFQVCVYRTVVYPHKYQ